MVSGSDRPKDEGGNGMTAVYERLQNCYKSIQDQICVRPKVASVLGSG